MVPQVLELRTRLEKIAEALSLPEKKKRAREIGILSQDPGFWKNTDEAGKIMAELSTIEGVIEKIEKIRREMDSAEDPGKVSLLAREIDKLELVTFLSGQYDKEGAILSLHAGSGGVDAMDWSEMLLRMYIRFAQRKGWKVTEVEKIAGDEAGIKSATLMVDGLYAYGYLKGEAGTHRLVRQSPFNADRLRQTSFCLVEVLPQLPSQEKIEIKDSDLEWQFFRASSQGGQNVQKVSTAVRLRHKPTGLTVTAQAERYQEQNRKIARQLLASRLWVLEKERAKEKEREFKGEYHPASWGTQIRSYVLHPYKLVKDLRTGVETSKVEQVLGGELDEFVAEEVKWNR